MVRIRQKLKNLIIVISLLGVAPIYLYLDLPVQAIIAGALVVGVWSDRQERYLLSTPIANLLSILAFVVYLLQIDRQNLVLPALNIAILLLAVRLLTEKQGRHFLQIFLLCGFALAGSTLLTLHLSFLPLMILMVCALIYGLVLLCFDASDPMMTVSLSGYRTLFRTTMLLPAGTLLLAILFFFILPRTQHPLWDFLNPGSLSMVGFSEEVSPGSVSGTATDQTVAFRAQVEDEVQGDLYWRMTVLNRLDGSVWKREIISDPGHSVPQGGKAVKLTIYPVAGNKKFLATLDPPHTVSGLRHSVRKDNIFSPSRKIKRVRSYDVVSRVGGKIMAAPGVAEDQYLQLPEAVAPRARKRIRSLLADVTGRADQVAVVKEFFRNQQLVYATQGLPTSGDPVDTFLFESKRGYCEHFASAFAVLLREAGVPVRLVGGYFGGDYNPLAGYYAVGERAAHVWVEYLDENRVWQRYDPNELAILLESGLLANIGQRPAGWRQLMDAVDYYWTQAVITLDFDRQYSAARRLWSQIRTLDRQRLASQAVMTVTFGLAVLVIWFVWRRGRWRQKPHNRMLRRFLKRLEQLEQKPTPGVGLIELAKRSENSAAQEFARLYGGALYRDRDLTAGELKELKRLLQQMVRSQG
jgi:transglutaminase-like putative cysteine protease